MNTLRISKKLTALFLALVFASVIIATPAFATGLDFDGQAIRKTYIEYGYEITNPYANVDWETFSQYKTNLHAHSTASDGDHTLAAMIEAYYVNGYDILGMADHGTRSLPWNQRPTHNGGLLDGLAGGRNTTVLTTARYNEILTGTDRNDRGMTQVLDANEQNPANNHVLSYYSSFNTSLTAGTLETPIREVNNRGGVTVVAHPGRYTNGNNTPAQVINYVNMFMRYSTCLGYEVSGKMDGETFHDRILWDLTLMQTAPLGRNVFGFANDDSHNINEVGRNWMMFLMPSNVMGDGNVRAAMEAGAFYSSSRYARPEGVDARQYIRNWDVPAPYIANISIDNNTITVEASFYNTIEWIADGNIIATGNSIDLVEYKDSINSYIRFQLKGVGGISWAQPMLLKLIETEVEYLACIECESALDFVSQDGDCYVNGFDGYFCECGYSFYIKIYETIGHELKLVYDIEQRLWFNICSKYGCNYREIAEAPVFSGTSPSQLNAFLAKSDVELTTPGSGGYGIAAGTTLIVPEGRTLYISTILNVRRGATLHIEGTVVVLEGGRLNSDGHEDAVTGTIVITAEGKIINEGYVEIAQRSTLTNLGIIANNGTIGNHGRFEVRTGTLFTQGVVTGTRTLAIHRDVKIMPPT